MSQQGLQSSQAQGTVGTTISALQPGQAAVFTSQTPPSGGVAHELVYVNNGQGPQVVTHPGLA